MTSRWEAEKRNIVETARSVAKLGLTVGSNGNVSVRLANEGSGDLLAITRSGARSGDLGPNDVAVVDFDVESVEPGPTPSSEALLHVAIYRARPDVGAVIHTHPVFATVAAVAGHEIPSVVDEVAVVVGGAIRVAEYAFPSTQELADNVCEALGDRTAALIRSHGAVGVGHDLTEALDVCQLTERAATIFVYASLLGKVPPLPADVLKAEESIYKMRRQANRGIR